MKRFPLDRVVIVLALLIAARAGAAQDNFVSGVTGDVKPWTHLEFKEGAEGFQFAIVGDNTGGARKGVFLEAVHKLNRLEPEFVISIGDLIEGSSAGEAELVREWEEFDSFVDQLEMPFFYVVGNHDITDFTALEVWKKRLGPTYYHFRYKDCLFLCLNSEDPPFSYRIGDEQIAWVEKTLKENADAPWTFVFLHKPLWEEGNVDRNGWARIEELLVDRPYTVFAGHWHQYVKTERNGRDYYTLATTGGSNRMRGPQRGEFDHVMWVTVADDGPRIVNITLDGTTLPDDVFTGDQAMGIRQLESGEAITSDPVLTPGETFDGGRTRLRVRNRAGLPLKLTGRFAPNPLLSVTPGAVEFTVPPSGEASEDLELKTESTAPVAELVPLVLEWTAVYEGAEENPEEFKGKHRVAVDRLHPCPARETPVTVDGNLDEWAELPYRNAVPAAGAAPAPGPEDASFEFAAAHDDEYVYFAVRATDDALVVDPGQDYFHQDGFQVWFDARPESEKVLGIRAAAVAMFDELLPIMTSCARPPHEARLFLPERLPEGTRVECRPIEGGLAAEFAIPVSYLNEKQGRDWEHFCVNVIQVDVDPGDNPRALSWRPQWFGFENYAGSGTFVRK